MDELDIEHSQNEDSFEIKIGASDKVKNHSLLYIPIID